MVSLFVFLGLGAVYRRELDQRREDCRRLALKVLASGLGQPRATPYSAGDPVSPINLYGRQKIESERAVLAAAAEFAVTLRVPLLLGNSATGQRSNHERLLADWAAGRTPKLFVDEFRQPCTMRFMAPR